MQPRQCVCIHVGQCGIQVGNDLWELFCIEHGIRPDGIVVDAQGEIVHNLPDAAKTFFHCSGDDKLIPRVIMVDLEPTVLGGHSEAIRENINSF